MSGLRNFPNRSTPPTDDGNIETHRLFYRVFTTPDGAKALEVLRKMTIERCLPPTASDSALRHAEGQRTLVRTIQNYIELGSNARRNRSPAAEE